LDTKDWNKEAVSIIKAELKRRGLSYRNLAERLEGIGVHDSERNVTNKINRGTFTAAFFLQCLEAIGCKTVRLDDF
jgi:lambda repressor-like predicted transcriptional regulator